MRDQESDGLDRHRRTVGVLETWTGGQLGEVLQDEAVGSGVGWSMTHCADRRSAVAVVCSLLVAGSTAVGSGLAVLCSPPSHTVRARVVAPCAHCCWWAVYGYCSGCGWVRKFVC